MERYPEHEGYGRNGGARFGRNERWGEDEDWRGRRQRWRGGRGAGFQGSEDHDEERFGREDWRGEGLGGYGGGYGQGMSGQTYGGGYSSRGEWERDYGRGGMGGSGGYGGGYSGQSGRSYGQGAEYGREPGQRYGQRQGYGGWGQSSYDQGGYGQGGPYGQGYGQAYGQGGGFGQEGGYEQGGYGQSQRFGQGGFGQQRQTGRFSGRGPKGYMRSDERIREDVNDRLTDDPEIDASEIEVKVSNCEVTLTGTVDSRFTKRRAEECVESVSGVRNVQNNLRVKSEGEESTPVSKRGGGRSEGERTQ